MGALRRAAQTALDVQNACNLSGVLHAWASVQTVLREHLGSGHPRHPINILFASKVASLMVVATDCIGGVYSGSISSEGATDLFPDAYAWCEDTAKGEPPSVSI